MIQKMESDSRQLIESIVSLVYFMRGAVSYGDMMWMTYGERMTIKHFLDERFEIEKKNPTPVY